jgi:N-acetylneuraminate lyase
MNRLPPSTESSAFRLVAAPFTPMLPDGSLDLEAIGPYANWLGENQIAGAFICGTTGEGMSLTTAERQRLAERWMAVAPAELQIMVHVGHQALEDCRDLARHAQRIGAHSIACLAPSFFRPASVAGLVEWCQQVAQAAPGLPFYYYHIPSMTGVTYKVYDFLELAAPRIPNLAGVKFTFEDLEDFQRCLAFDGGRMDMLFGRDEILLSAWKLGARGAVGSTYNFAAPIYHAMLQACQGGEEEKAAQWQAEAVAMIELLVKAGPQPVATFKWFMSQVGVDCGGPRLPLVTLSTTQREALQASLAASGLRERLRGKR